MRSIFEIVLAKIKLCCNAFAVLFFNLLQVASFLILIAHCSSFLHTFYAMIACRTLLVSSTEASTVQPHCLRQTVSLSVHLLDNLTV